MNTRKFYFQVLVLLVFSLYFLINANGTLAHGGNTGIGDDHYQVSYSEDDISMKKIGLEIPEGSSIEINVSITEQNTSMTIIVEIERNTGTLWGLYFENQSTYYHAKNNSIDPRIFCTTGLSICCQKIFDHVSYYAITHINRTVNDSYVIALFNTHDHEEDDTKFNLIILKGHIGEETFILKPPAENDPVLSFVILTLVLGIGSLAVGLVTYTLLIMPRRRK